MTQNPKICPKCSSPVTPGMKFCETCGAKIETAPVCQKCGAPLSPGIRFCETCGAPASQPVVQEAAAPVAPPVVAPAPEKPVAPAVTPIKAEEKTQPAPEKPVAPAVTPIKAEEKPEPVRQSVETAQVKEVPKETGAKKPIPQTTLIIAGIVVLLILGAAAIFIVLPLLSGAGTPSETPATPVIPDSGSTATSGGQSGEISLVPGPTDALPANRALVIDVEKNAISRDIIVTFQGGSGQYGVKELRIKLSKSDGTVEEQSLSRLERGSSITMKGTDRDDRVEVTAYFNNGEIYKVVDKVFEYKKRMGTY